MFVLSLQDFKCTYLNDVKCFTKGFFFFRFIPVGVRCIYIK